MPTSPEADHARQSAIGGRLLFTLALLSALGPLAIDAYLPGFTAMAEDLDTPASAVSRAGGNVGRRVYPFPHVRRSTRMNGRT